MNSPEWRSWSNPEFLLSDKGLRLDELDEPRIRDAIINVLKVTLSPEGYEKAIGAMRINGFLGELVEAPPICTEISYNFVLFGEPSTTTPWGLSFHGHHLCLNILLYRSQIVIFSWFAGAEANLIDGDSFSRPYSGTCILHVKEASDCGPCRASRQCNRARFTFSSYSGTLQCLRDGGTTTTNATCVARTGITVLYHTMGFPCLHDTLAARLSDPYCLAVSLVSPQEGARRPPGSGEVLVP